MDTPQDIPCGYCHCGCGQKTPVAARADARWSAVKDEPRRFVKGHRSRKPLIERLEERIEIRGVDDCWLWTGRTSTQGYGRVTLPGGNGTGAHRAITTLFHGPPAPKDEARHLCGVRLCCNPWHLAWGTRADNEADKVRHGRSNRGRPGMAKVSEEQVRDIFVRRSAGAVARDLAFEYRLSPQAIADIMAGRSWSWVTEDLRV